MKKTVLFIVSCLIVMLSLCACVKNIDEVESDVVSEAPPINTPPIVSEDDTNEEEAEAPAEAPDEIVYGDFPVIIINTADGADIVSKEDYIRCEVSVENAKEKYLLTDEGAKIRGRGNTTWGMPKKPYKLKFDSKIDLFGNGKAKTWTLIANYADQSLIRNYLALSLGSLFESLEYTSSVQFIDLYLNGKYEGVYLVCEQIEVNKNRVDIGDTLGNPDMGYLVELDSRAVNEGEEGIDYVVVNGAPYGIKSPDTKGADYTQEYAQFIQNFLTECSAAVWGNSWDAVTEYVDIETFAESYVLNDIFKTVDIGHTSFFMYKPAGGKLHCGPIWDYDLSTGNCDYVDNYVPDRLYANVNTWYGGLLRFDEFNEIVREKLIEYRDILDAAIDSLIDEAYEASTSFERNFDRWDILGKYVWPNASDIAPLSTWQAHVEYLRNWLHASLDYVYDYYCGVNE